MNRICVITGIVAVLTLTGCFRTYTLTQTRTDQDIRGNQGFVKAADVDAQKETAASAPRQRELIGLDMEFPSINIEDINRRRAERRSLTAREDSIVGNKGCIYTK